MASVSSLLTLRYPYSYLSSIHLLHMCLRPLRKNLIYVYKTAFPDASYTCSVCVCCLMNLFQYIYMVFWLLCLASPRPRHCCLGLGLGLLKTASSPTSLVSRLAGDKLPTATPDRMFSGSNFSMVLSVTLPDQTGSQKCKLAAGIIIIKRISDNAHDSNTISTVYHNTEK